METQYVTVAMDTKETHVVLVLMATSAPHQTTAVLCVTVMETLISQSLDHVTLRLVNASDVSITPPEMSVRYVLLVSMATPPSRAASVRPSLSSLSSSHLQSTDV